MSDKRRHFTPAEKLAQLKRDLLEDISVSSICDEFAIKPTQFYQWKEQFFDNGEAAFASSHTKNKAEERQQQRMTKLEEKLRKKDEIIAIITEEHFQLKKDLGGI
jgi:transposase-like protein